MTREEAINKIRQWSLPKETRDILEALAPELRESEDENLKNKSGYYKDGKFWKASTLWNATRNKVPQRVSNIYNILRECTWNIRTLEDFAKEVKNVQEVSLNYPIILDMNGNIIDGAHRVVKAYLEGKDINIVYLGDNEWPEPDYDEEKAVRGSNDERIKKSLIKFLTDIKEISESGRTTWAVRKEDAEMCKSFLDYLGKQKVQDKCPEYCVRSHCIGCSIYEKQKEQKEESLRDFIDNFPYSDEQKITGVTINGEPISTENQSVDIPLAEWSEEDKKMLNHLIDKIQENLNIRMPDGYSFGISNDEKETFSSWLRCLPERFNLQPNQEWSKEDEAAYNAFICEVVNEKMNPTIEQVKWLRGICDRLKSFYPQSKQEWNNEDKSMLNTIITDVGFMQRKCGIGTDEWNVRSKAIQWLKNLLERFNPPKQEWKEVELEFRGEKVKIKRPFFRDDKGREYSTTEQDEDVAWYALRAWCDKKGISLYDLYPKNEWSEEDEEMLEYVIGDVNDAKQLFTTKEAIDLCDKEIAWLKSLRPQYHGDVTMTEAYKMGFEAGKASSWKPSKEQMDSLRDTMANTKGYSYSIYLLDLYEQLKKLM